MESIDKFSHIEDSEVLLNSDSPSQLCYPVIGDCAVLFYDYLSAFLDDGVKRHKLSEILNHLQLSTRQMEEAFAILTIVDLPVLYQIRDAYVLELQPASNRETFLSNPVYRHLLEQEIGDVAVAELDIRIPQEVRDIPKRFSDISSAEGALKPKANVSKNHFDLDSFERLVLHDGLQFKGEKAGVVPIYSLADKCTMNQFNIYYLAKNMATSGKISSQRMTVQLEQPKNAKPQGQSKEQFDIKEQVITREVRQVNVREFLEKIKTPRRAVVTESEQKLLEELASMSLLDEAINVMVFHTLDKTQSADFDKPYIMEVANDLAYQNITTAEAAVLKIRSFAQRNKDRRAQAKVTKNNVPEWTAKEYKHVATAEEKVKLEELKRSMLKD